MDNIQREITKKEQEIEKLKGDAQRIKDKITKDQQEMADLQAELAKMTEENKK